MLEKDKSSSRPSPSREGSEAEEKKQEEVKQEEAKEEVQPPQEEVKEEAKPEEKLEEKLKEDKPSSRPSSPKGDLEKEEVKPEPKPEPKPEAKPEPKPEPKKPVKVPAKFKKLVEEIEKMSVLDLAELVKILEDKFGVSAVAPMIAAPAAGAAPAGGAPAQGKTKFTIELTAVGDKKIETIKAVRDVTQKGLKDSKDLVDAVASGTQVVKENVKKEEAEEIKKKFEAAGATVELK